MATTNSIGTRTPSKATPKDTNPAAAPLGWWQQTWVLALLGSALYWAALPPLGWWPLAWLAPIPWLLLIRQTSLAGKRPYRTLWLVGFVFWLATVYWITLPHWATSIGWLAMSGYMAVYFPLFIGLSRVAVHHLRIPLWVAAPVIWAGLELVQAHMLTGFLMAAISNTQYRWPLIIQISDLVGSYGVSFLILLVAAGVASALPWRGARFAWWPLLPAAVCLAATLTYGNFRLSEETTKLGPKVALIQGSIDIEMKHDPTQGQRIFDEYFGLSRQVVNDHNDLDLIVWPETMFRYPWFTFDKEFTPPADAKWTVADAEATSQKAVRQTVEPLGAPLLLGIDVVHESKERVHRYNAAMFVDPEGKVLGRYDKCHRVLFGEYVPFGDVLPWLYQLTPLPNGLDAGAGPQSVEVGETRYSPTICYENTLPHLVRSGVSQLRSEQHEPDVLVNLTNDGWFWGSSELDLHLACAVFRAVECRKPFVISANTGFSASITSNGEILAQGRRRASDTLVTQLQLDRRRSWYVDLGDAFSGLCLVGTGFVAIVALRERRNARQSGATQGVR